MVRMTIASALVLAGCAAIEPPADDGADLAAILDGRVAAETRSCVSASSGASLNPVNSRNVIYDSGRTVWVNRLRGECPGLGTAGALIVESASGQYCSGDRFRELEWGSTIPGPYCILGEFTAYRRPR